jgi:hypothetical protein
MAPRELALLQVAALLGSDGCGRDGDAAATPSLGLGCPAWAADAPTAAPLYLPGAAYGRALPDGARAHDAVRGGGGARPACEVPPFSRTSWDGRRAPRPAAAARPQRADAPLLPAAAQEPPAKRRAGEAVTWLGNAAHAGVSYNAAPWTVPAAAAHPGAASLHEVLLAALMRSAAFAAAAPGALAHQVGAPAPALPMAPPRAPTAPEPSDSSDGSDDACARRAPAVAFTPKRRLTEQQARFSHSLPALSYKCCTLSCRRELRRPTGPTRRSHALTRRARARPRPRRSTCCTRRSRTAPR